MHRLAPPQPPPTGPRDPLPQAKVTKQFSDKAEMLKKGTSPSDMNKRLTAHLKPIEEAKAEYNRLVSDLFSTC
jgi:hypothetical protein